MSTGENTGQAIEIDRLLDAIDSRIDVLQKKMVEATGYLGFIKSTFRDSHERWLSIPRSGIVTRDNQDFLSSTGGVLRAILNEFETVDKDVSYIHKRIEGVAGSSTVFASGMNAFASVSSNAELPRSSIVIYSPFDRYHKHKEYEERLRLMDASLGRTYGELVEVVHATAKDPTRSGMFMARQLFDHFFDILAPDSDVRSSKFWRPKSIDESSDQNAVWKSEKLDFAVAHRVRDEYRRQTLSAMSRQTIDLYNLLNKAHTRGPIMEVQASRAVESMIRLLQQWIDSI